MSADQWETDYKAERLIDLAVLDAAAYAHLNAYRDLYMIQMGDDGPVKIGVAGDIPSRLAALQTSNPYPLRVIASFAGLGLLERRLHKTFASARLAGEWFHPCEDVMSLARGEFPSVILGRIAPNPIKKPWCHVTRHDLEDFEVRWSEARDANPRWRLALEWWHSELQSQLTVGDFFGKPVSMVSA